MNNGILYIVATPIGNLKDITYRAVEILKNVDYIACEDTRHSQILLREYNINKELYSYYKEKEQRGSEKIINDLKSGKNIALITDAGMPCISDPGSILVDKINKNNLSVKIVPGPCACVGAFALSGELSKGFTFIGFLPNKEKEIKNILDNIDNYFTSLIIYIAPHDLKDNLIKLKNILGDRKIYLIKEMTKIHESIMIGKISEILPQIDNVKGEFVLVISPKEKETIENEDPETLLKFYINSGLDFKTAIKKVSRELSLVKDDVYKIYLQIAKTL